MTIPWVQVYSNLPTHRKICRLADLLGLNNKNVQPEVIAVGIVINLWTWAIQNCPNGWLTVSTRAIAKACGWTGNPDKLYEALIATDFVESDGYIHDWDEYAGLLLEQEEHRKAKNREYVARSRERKSKEECKGVCKGVCKDDVSLTRKDECKGDVSLTETLQAPYGKVDVRGLPNQTKPNHISISDIERENREFIPPTPKNQPSQVKHKHGEYGNVLLTDEEMEKLKAEFPSDWRERIERLSAYIASSGKSYKNHLATIRNWARTDKEKQTTSEPQQRNRSYTNDDIKAYEEWARQAVKEGA